MAAREAFNARPNLLLNDWESIRRHAIQHGLYVIGVDEAGRGPLCGPVVAGAVLLAEPCSINGLACSKTLSASKRDLLARQIQESAQAWAVAQASVEEIDQLNILQASLLAMHRAVQQVVELAQLNPSRCLVLVDGNKLPAWPFEAIAVIKGDTKIPAISAASILAKVNRDEWCKENALKFPQYELDVNMGYPTARHMALLTQHGAATIHRRSFRPVREALQNSRQEQEYGTVDGH
ncbi:MAG TPA: ribonuclease HII [Limnobacter sp.]|nr:ribonuclease HII [Limnobacter sp.]